ncbi:unnamed protein product [Pylaiella littoralis]
MNLVGGYDSSDDDADEAQQQQPTALGLPKGKGIARPFLTPLSALPATATATSKQQQQQQRAEDANEMKKRKSSKSKKKKTTTSGKKRKKSKTVNALVLSPEIQAALARGDTLGDSDSDDDDAPDKKPPKIVRRPAGSDPNDLLSLLPQPSTAASAGDILLKNQKKRQEAKAAKSKPAPAGTSTPEGAASTAAAAAAAAEAAAEGSGGGSTSRTTAKPTTTGRAGSGGNNSGDLGDDADQESDSDDDGDDLLAGMHARSAAAGPAASDSQARTSSLFTLPSRARPPPGAAAAGVPLPAEETEAVGAVPPTRDHTAVRGGGGYFEGGAQDHGSVGQKWGATGEGHSATSLHGGYGGAATEAGVSQHASYEVAPGQHTLDSCVPRAIFPLPPMRHQQQQAPYYQPAAAQAAARFGGAAEQGAGGGHAAEVGEAGGKATRRKGRDMERALTRGDLGALGSELPVMDLHQGSNEYNPLRTKPITAAMKQDQKHIESHVYDPSTGKTVKTLEPTSTQKRKHQINQLAVQAASMERDLMERSGASRLTKAQTHAKYGW